MTCKGGDWNYPEKKRYKMESWTGREISSGKPWNGKGNWGKQTLNFGMHSYLS